MDIRKMLTVFENISNTHEEEIAAVSQLLIDKAEDSNAPAKLKTSAFIKLANQMGLALTADTLMNLAQEGDLQNIIKDVNDTDVTFKGKQDVDDNAKMNVDRARDVVKDMAKNRVRKGMKK